MPHNPHYRRELGDGLLLRWATPADVEGVASLYSFVYRDKESDPPNTRAAATTRDYMSGRHPQVSAGEFAIVEDTRSGSIVASTCLMSARWEYAGVGFGVGRPEMVATLPEYRRRGLIRNIFELIHARSEQRGDLVQGITGIAYYYRQFGYDYALDLGGSRSVTFDSIVALKEGEAEPYTLRPASSDDLPFVLGVYEQARKGARRTQPPLVSTPLHESYLQWVMHGASDEASEAWGTYIITSNNSQSVGYIWASKRRYGTSFTVLSLELDGGVSLDAVLPSMLRQLKELAPGVPGGKADVPPPTSLRFLIAGQPPLAVALGNWRTGSYEAPYAWYVRVPDLPAFVRLIAPVLEQRLATSPLAGYSGELRLDFYRGGARLVFEQGRLTASEPWQKPVWGEGGNAGFPPLVFLQLLFGHRSLEELRHSLYDVRAEGAPGLVLETLFPKQNSWVIPQD